MSFCVLIVEDDPDFLEEIREVFTEVPGQTNMEVVRSRDSAVALLSDSFFDLIVLDLKIPTIDGALDAAPEHGHAVFSRARSVSHGTPVFVLTGSPIEDFVPAMLRQQEQVDIWGEGKRIGTIEFLRKLKFEDFPSRLIPIASAVHALADIELERAGLNLTLAEDRLLRIFAKRFGGAHCTISMLGGGLSGAKVIRLKVTDISGMPVHDAVAKIGSPEEIRDEATRFDTLVCRLDPAATPRKLVTLEYGGGARSGVFYGLATGYEAPAFELALRLDGKASATVRSIEQITSKWSAGLPQSRRSITSIRRRCVADDTLPSLRDSYPLEWINTFEQGDIQTRWGCGHGDLHGSNALVSEDGSAAILIDYGDVGDGPVCLDAITLELSLIFHTQRPKLNDWPSIDQAKHWGNLEIYLVGCPAAEFIRECRAWAARVSAGKRDMAVTAYSYLLRQLKYADTDKTLILALLEGVRNSYAET